MKKLWASLLIIVCLLVVLAWSMPARAQTGAGCPGGANCIDTSNFDSGLNGWGPFNASVDWLSHKQLGWGADATGIMRISDGTYPLGAGPLAGAYKSFYLQPGAYTLIFRAGQDATFLTNRWDVYILYPDRPMDPTIYETRLSAWYFSDYQTGVFWVTQPETIRIEIGSADTAITGYFDSIWLEREPDTSPTATPLPTFYWASQTPGGPTATLTPAPTISATPIPTDQQATPIPPGTPVCVNAAPTSAGIPLYGSPTPTPAFYLSRLDTWKSDTFYSNSWQHLGDVHQGSDDHTGDGSLSASIAYDNHGSATMLSTFTNALIFPISFGEPIWVNVWGTSDAVPIGQTAKLQVWQQITGTWELAGETSISAGKWYPLHVAIDAASTGLAFVGSRSDAPTSGHVEIDDVYLYAPETNAPYCNGGYPSDVMTLDGKNPNELSINGPGTLWWPADRPCPGTFYVPNNFWGPVLQGVALIADNMFAWSPLHPAGWMTVTAQTTLLSPVGVLFTFSAILLDWTIPIQVLKFWMLIQGIYWAIMAWRIIRYSTVE